MNKKEKAGLLKKCVRISNGIIEDHLDHILDRLDNYLYDMNEIFNDIRHTSKEDIKKYSKEEKNDLIRDIYKSYFQSLAIKKVANSFNSTITIMKYLPKEEIDIPCDETKISQKITKKIEQINKKYDQITKIFDGKKDMANANI